MEVTILLKPYNKKWKPLAHCDETLRSVSSLQCLTSSLCSEHCEIFLHSSRSFARSRLRTMLEFKHLFLWKKPLVKLQLLASLTEKDASSIETSDFVSVKLFGTTPLDPCHESPRFKLVAFPTKFDTFPFSVLYNVAAQLSLHSNRRSSNYVRQFSHSAEAFIRVFHFCFALFSASSAVTVSQSALSYRSRFLIVLASL